MKSLLSAFLIAIMVGGFALAGTMRFSTVQAATNVNGIIDLNTTWTKVNSPYNLTGNVAIDAGVTLTIESGVTVNLDKYYIRVNGTLTAKGSNTDQINFIYGRIEFTESSTSWNEMTHTGSLIENAILSTRISIHNASPKINNNTITAPITVGRDIGNFKETAPIISKNTIIAHTSHDWLGRPNSAEVGIYLDDGNTAYISDNRFSGVFVQAAINIDGGSPTIERNLITNDNDYSCGILIGRQASPLIQGNTITKNNIGISWQYGTFLPTIVYNNIQNNFNYNIYLDGTKNNVDAINNWWGTTDTATISQKIYDFDDDFNLGKVTFVPILTEPNPNANPDPNAPIPTSTPSTSPSQIPTTKPSQETQQTELTIIMGAAIAAIVFGAGLGLLIYLIKRK